MPPSVRAGPNLMRVVYVFHHTLPGGKVAVPLSDAEQSPRDYRDVAVARAFSGAKVRRPKGAVHTCVIAPRSR
jgi:hypothetical protein